MAVAKVKKYVSDSSKIYYTVENLFGGPNRFAIRIQKDYRFWKDKPEAIAFRKDWPQYFNKTWREKNYGEDFVWEDLVDRK